MTERAPIRVLIVDDEPLARRRLRRLLDGRDDFEVVAEAGDGRSAVGEIQRLAPDLVFLDIQMPDLDGFGVLSQLEVASGGNLEAPPVLVFVTAYDRYTLEAFEVRAIDYLLKPFEDERFEQALATASEQISARRARVLWQQLAQLADQRADQQADSTSEASDPSDASANDPPLLRLPIAKKDHIDIVQVADIEWIEASGPYVRLHLQDGTSHLLRDRLKRLEATLDSSLFVRVHRSAMVCVDRVQRLHPLFHGEYELQLISGARVRLSRSYRDRLSRFGI